jgi:hypothetical protein
VLRPITTSLVIEEMLRGTSIIYVTYTDYDEIAHHSGPQRAETLDALDGIDRVLASIAKAEEDAPRPYNLVVLSDHGQTLGATFKQRYGRSLDDLIEQLMGGADQINAAVNDLDEWHVVNAFATEMTRVRGAARATRRALKTRTGQMVTASGAATFPAAESGDGQPDLVVCPSGNLALVYFPEIKGRADLETLNERYPGMVDALANHPGVGLVMVRSTEHGALVIGPQGVHHLGEDMDKSKVDKKDPLEQFGPYAADALKRLDGMSNVGDLVLVSMFEPELAQVAAFEELIGSHGGLGGPQTEPLILYPHEWQLDAEPLVGAPAVYTQLQTWLGQQVTAPTAEQTEKTSDRPTTYRRRRRARQTTKAAVPSA